MVKAFALLLLFLLPGVSVRADRLLDEARRARDLLGPDTWARILRIETAAGAGAETEVVPAVVFELEDRLWYYVPGVGTQSLSQYAGRLEQDKADLAPLLRAAEPGYRRHAVVEAAAGGAPVRRPRGRLSAGCFIESVAYLRTMIASGRAPDDARLLAYYATTGAGVRGHTVLYFERDGQRFAYDPERPAFPTRIPSRISAEPLEIARATAPGGDYARPQRAKFLPLQLPRFARPDGELVASGPAAEDAVVMAR